MANSLEIKSTRLVCPAEKTSLTRDALLAQGIAVVFALGAWGLNWVNDPQATSLASLCGTAAFVISMWAVVLSLRAVRCGERPRIPSAIVALSVANLGGWSLSLWGRLLAVSGNSTPTYKTLCELAAPVLFPALAVAMALAILDARSPAPTSRFSKLRLVALKICSVLFLTACVVIAPAALFLMSALNMSEKIGIAWQPAVIEHTPDFIAASVDRVCARVDYLQPCHRVLGKGDYLPETRVIENLQDDDVGTRSAERLFKLNRNVFFAEAVKAGTGQIRVSVDVLPYLATVLGRFGRKEQIAAVLGKCDTVEGKFLDQLIGGLEQSDHKYRLDVYPMLLEAIVRGRLCRALAVRTMSAMHWALNSNQDNWHWDKARLYFLWSALARDQEFLSARETTYVSSDVLGKLETCLLDADEAIGSAKSKDLRVRRTATVALARSFFLPTNDIPLDDLELDQWTDESADEIIERNHILLNVTRILEPVRAKVRAIELQKYGNGS